MIDTVRKNKDIIEKNFSRYAHLYDGYANAQRMTAHELMKETPDDNVMDILEIGCGTGNYTLLLREKFKKARIVALDISDGMIRIANQKLEGRQVKFVTADAEALDLNEKFDLITSNAAFQWFDDLEGTVIKYKALLTKEGLISFSTFGPLTFYELGRSLKEALGNDIKISADNFLDGRELKMILKRYFSSCDVRESVIKEEYRSLRELLNTIKYTGVRGCVINTPFFWKVDILDNIEKIYKLRYGQIAASYQIFFCRGQYGSR